MAGSRSKRWAAKLRNSREQKVPGETLWATGRLRRVVGLTLEAVGVEAALGERCWVLPDDGSRIETEVVGFTDESIFLMPVEEVRGLSTKAKVIPAGMALEAPVGRNLLGRVIDGAGNPLDGKGPLKPNARSPLMRPPINPLHRHPIREPLDVGVRSINALLTVGRGQRLGLFAGSGVGKSTLLGMMTRFTNADVVVVALIGERGREVRDFIENTLGPEGMRRAVIVATPADQVPLMRMRGAWLATTIAEYFRDQGLEVLLLMDSLTRFAQAKREIALAVGEPPATKGYPPSVFASLPALVERAGTGVEGGGAITAFYTVLAEGDDNNDPIVDASRAILDGHIVLSRAIAEEAIYPAIDIEASISRVMPEITSDEHQMAAQRFRQVFATYRQNQDLIAVGAYRKGSDPRLDEAVDMRPQMLDFLRQRSSEPMALAASLSALDGLMADSAGDQLNGT